MATGDRDRRLPAGSRAQQIGARRKYITALTQSRREMLSVCQGLTDAEWGLPSAADGWSIQDVVAHLGAGCHAIFTPAVLAILRSDDIERANDAEVDRRRDWSVSRTMSEYETWSNRLVRLARFVLATPGRRMPLRLAELGRFPAGLLLTGAFVFDHHTHLRFDIAPVLDVELPSPQAHEVGVAIEWMMAVLSNQIRSGALGTIPAPVVLNLRGDGGSSWTVSRDGVRRGSASNAVATIDGIAASFPAWGTRRAPWRGFDVTLSGEVDYAAAVLDQVNVI